MSQLKRIPPNDPHYAKAQTLIAQWTGGTAPGDPAAAGAATPGAPAGAVPAALNAETTARRAALLAAAQQASAQSNYIRALGRLEQADALAKLDGADAQLLASTRQRLAPLASQIDLFRQHEWEHALPDLWRMHDSDPANRDVTQLIVDSYYNLAVRDLQRADAKKAGENLKEALNLQQDDETLEAPLPVRPDLPGAAEGLALPDLRQVPAVPLMRRPGKPNDPEEEPLLFDLPLSAPGSREEPDELPVTPRRPPPEARRPAPAAPAATPIAPAPRQPLGAGPRAGGRGGGGRRARQGRQRIRRQRQTARRRPRRSGGARRHRRPGAPRLPRPGSAPRASASCRPSPPSCCRSLSSTPCSPSPSGGTRRAWPGRASPPTTPPRTASR